MSYWTFAIKAGQDISFNRMLHFPSNQGNFNVVVNVTNPGRIIDGVDSFVVVLYQNRGEIIREGTSVPLHNPDVTMPVFGPGTPAPSRITNPTNPWVETAIPSRTTTLAPTLLAPLVATSTPRTSPYPPPPTSTPIPTRTLTPTSHPYP